MLAQYSYNGHSMNGSMTQKLRTKKEFKVPSLHDGAKAKNSCFQPIPAASCTPLSNLAGGYYVGGSLEHI